MTDIQQLSRWNRDVSRAIAALGTEEFFPALIDAVRGQVAIDYPQIWLYHRDLPPQVLYHEIPPAAIASQIDQYLDGPYREDPFYQASMNQPKSKIYRLSRVTAGKLEQLRLPKHHEFSEQEYESLYLLAEPVSELLKSHSSHDDFAATHLIQPGIDHQIDMAFKTFGESILSPREKDVLELMLRGYGTDISAERLNIALETVRRHRKSIYRKLDVSSQTDLFSLFINSMSCIGEAAGADPLSIYMSPR
jgi:DNA-binding CsgD family transcriptional regulator